MERPAVGEIFSRLVADGRAFAQAKITLYRKEATYRGKSAGLAAGFAYAALSMLQVALTALAVGLIMTVATLVGPGWATLIVVIAFLALAALFGSMAWQNALASVAKDDD